MKLSRHKFKIYWARDVNKVSKSSKASDVAELVYRIKLLNVIHIAEQENNSANSWACEIM